MEIQKILWPTDFSENAALALPLVTSLSQKYGAEIHILFVMKEIPAFGAHYGEYDPEEQKKLQKADIETAEKKLDDLCAQFLNACPLFFRHVKVGDPARVILEFIKEHEVDLVIMSSRGSESHFDFGSVADRVIKFAGVPTLVIPA